VNQASKVVIQTVMKKVLGDKEGGGWYGINFPGPVARRLSEGIFEFATQGTMKGQPVPHTPTPQESDVLVNLATAIAKGAAGKMGYLNLIDGSQDLKTVRNTIRHEATHAHEGWLQRTSDLLGQIVPSNWVDADAFKETPSFRKAVESLRKNRYSGTDERMISEILAHAAGGSVGQDGLIEGIGLNKEEMQTLIRDMLKAAEERHGKRAAEVLSSFKPTDRNAILAGNQPDRVEAGASTGSVRGVPDATPTSPPPGMGKGPSGAN
jgi:hypothetical protein